jgi:transcriptional regulator with XRE-family HTH domain
MTWFEQRHRDPQRQHGFDLFGRTLRRRRLWLGWTQRQLEAYSGIDQAVICRLENGKQYGLRWARLADLINALGGLEVGPGSPDPPGYTRSTVGSPRIDLTGGLDASGDLVDPHPPWSAST